MRIHLVTYATPRFRLRQLILGWSAQANRVVDTVTHWTPDKLLAAGFEERCKGILLSERGSGFWAWKPFIIAAKLREVPEGDVVFYCDVGRLYPFKLLDQPVLPFVRWMDEHGQDIMPGIEIPWDGPNSTWTKREALASFDVDRTEVHASSPVQASFSIWRVSPESRDFVELWLDRCAQRQLVSDDPSRSGLEELPGFRGHRHDQALLSLCCISRNIQGLSIGHQKPPIDSRHPSEVSCHFCGKTPGQPTWPGRLLRAAVWPIEHIEQQIRQNVKFGEPTHE